MREYTLIKALLEGTAWSTLGALGLFSTLAFVDRKFACVGQSTGGLFDADFASRWDGTCTGWTHGLCLLHMAGNLLTWWAYVTIAIVIMRLHPILHSVWSAKYTVVLMVSVFVTCGATHLIQAYTTLNPVYRIAGWFNLFAGLVGLTGAVLIAHSLVHAFARVTVERKRLRELEDQLVSRPSLSGG